MGAENNAIEMSDIFELMWRSLYNFRIFSSPKSPASIFK